MTSHHHAHDVSKPSPRSSQPPSKSSTISPVFILVTRAGGLSRQRALDLLMLQEQIASASRNALHACQLELRDDGRLAILAVQARPVPSLLGKQSASKRS
jgi:hypothetical protein